MVDYDINTQLYTPLPEPRIMQMSGDEARVSPVSSIRKLIPFNFAIDTLKTICKLANGGHLHSEMYFGLTSIILGYMYKIR